MTKAQLKTKHPTSECLNLIRGRVPGAGHSFFREQKTRFAFFASNCLQTSCGAAGGRNKALRASTLLEAVGVTRIYVSLVEQNKHRLNGCGVTSPEVLLGDK